MAVWAQWAEKVSHTVGSAGRGRKMKRRPSHRKASGTEKLGLHFEPDVLIQHKYSDLCRANIYLEPERMLMLAVLEDAIYCFQHFYPPTDHRARDLFRDAQAWFWDDRLDWPYSYANVCQFLGFDVDYLRHGLLRWQELRLPAGSPLAAQPVIGPRPYHSSR